LNEGNKKTAAAPVLAPPPMVCGCGRRVSRILFPAKTYVKTGGDHFSGIPIARNLKQPTRELFVAPGRRYSLFGLAAGGVYLAVEVTIDAVRSYRTISPLPEAIFPALQLMRVGRIAPAVSFLLHFPSDCSALMLSSTVPWKMPV